MKNDYHVPVLLKECIEGLNLKQDGIYVDVTYGGGGHSAEILKHLTSGKLIAFDQDEDAVNRFEDDERFVLVRQNFKYLKNYLKMMGIKQIDGLLADLGVSSHQFDIPERGFSIRFEAKLDMRMDRKQKKSAITVLNTYDEQQLRKVFAMYGEIKNAGQLSRNILKARIEKPIETVFELNAIAEKCVNKKKVNQYLAQVFQAIRIEVNDEMDALQSLLTQSEEMIKQGGRLVVMSYHSLEDRMVKNFMKKGNFEGKDVKDFYGNPIKSFDVLSSKVVTPSEEEIKINSRARSAKLRIAIKK
jgi:16S rRNA (cytosine1402-N4)-methyltransferase